MNLCPIKLCPIKLCPIKRLFFPRPVTGSFLAECHYLPRFVFRSFNRLFCFLEKTSFSPAFLSPQFALVCYIDRLSLARADPLIKTPRRSHSLVGFIMLLSSRNLERMSPTDEAALNPRGVRIEITKERTGKTFLFPSDTAIDSASESVSAAFHGH